jgi:predicted nucleic-acid-binding Zn-ribbon protein
MSCISCGSNDNAEFVTELIIHFSGLENLDKPGVRAFPRLLVCLNCGYSHFIVQESELASVARGARTLGTMTPESRLDSLPFHSRSSPRPE